MEKLELIKTYGGIAALVLIIWQNQTALDGSNKQLAQSLAQLETRIAVLETRNEYAGQPTDKLLSRR